MANYTSDLKTWGSTGQEPPDNYQYVEGEQPVDAWDNWMNSNAIADIEHLISLTNDRLESEKGTSHPSSPEVGHVSHRTDTSNLVTAAESTFIYDTENSEWRRLMKADGDTISDDLDTASAGLLWDSSAGYIPQGRLENDSVTVAGNGVSLGGSTDIALGDLSNVTATGEGSGNGLDADTIDGEHAGAFADTNHGNEEHNTNFTTLTEVNNNADVPNADYADSAGYANNAGDADTVDGYEGADLQTPNSTGENSPRTFTVDVIYEQFGLNDGESTSSTVNGYITTATADDGTANTTAYLLDGSEVSIGGSPTQVNGFVQSVETAVPDGTIGPDTVDVNAEQYVPEPHDHPI